MSQDPLKPEDRRASQRSDRDRLSASYTSPKNQKRTSQESEAEVDNAPRTSRRSDPQPVFQDESSYRDRPSTSSKNERRRSENEERRRSSTRSDSNSPEKRKSQKSFTDFVERLSGESQGRKKESITSETKPERRSFLGSRRESSQSNRDKDKKSFSSGTEEKRTSVPLEKIESSHERRVQEQASIESIEQEIRNEPETSDSAPDQRVKNLEEMEKEYSLKSDDSLEIEEDVPRRASSSLPAEDVPRRASSSLPAEDVPRRASSKLDDVPRRYSSKAEDVPRRASSSLPAEDAPRRASSKLDDVPRRASTKSEDSAPKRVSLQSEDAVKRASIKSEEAAKRASVISDDIPKRASLKSEEKKPSIAEDINEPSRSNESQIRCSSQSKLGTCGRRDLLLKEAEKTIENKDVIIKMLQDQVKKMEETYKNNLRETEDYRYKYCQASEQVNKLRNICSKHEQHKQFGCKMNAFPENEIKSIKREFMKWKQQYEQLVNQLPTKQNVPSEENCHRSESFMKFHCEVLNTLIQKIIEQKYTNKSLDRIPSGTSKCACGFQGLPTIDEETRNKKLAEILELREEITKLKEENMKLREQELAQNQSEPRCENVYQTENFEKTSSILDGFVEEELDPNRKVSFKGESVPRTGSNYSQETENYNFTFTDKEGVQSVSAERIYIHTSSQNVTPRENNSNIELIMKLKEINEKIDGLERKENENLLELKSFKEQLSCFNDTTSNCLREICKLKKCVHEQKENSSTKMVASCNVIDCLTSEISDLKKNVAEMRKEIENLIQDMHESKLHPHRSVIISPDVVENNIEVTNEQVHIGSKGSKSTESNITVEECSYQIDGMNMDKNPISSTNVFMNKSFSGIMHEDTKKHGDLHLPDNYEMLKEHFADLQREKDEKEKQINWLKELIDYYSKLNEEKCALAQKKLSECIQVEEDVKKNCGCDGASKEERFNACMEKILVENSKLKSAISSIMHCLRNKICGEQKQSEANADEKCLCGDRTEENASAEKIKSEDAVQDDNNLGFEKPTGDSKDCSCGDSNLKMDINLEIIAEAEPEKAEVSIEDIYKSVKCSCMSLAAKAEDPGKKSEKNNNSYCTFCNDTFNSGGPFLNCNSITASPRFKSDRSTASSKITDDCVCKVSCLDDEEKLDLLCNSMIENVYKAPIRKCPDENRGLLCNLESYFDYLQQQLEVICNIEGQIEHMRNEVKSQHQFRRACR